MIKKNWTVFLAVSIILSLILFFYYQYSKLPTYNWSENYKHNSDSPYGNELLYKMMKNLYPDHTFNIISEPLIYNREFTSSTKNNSIYFYSGYGFFPDKSTTSELINFIKKGNQLFIASNEISKRFLDSILDLDKSKHSEHHNALGKLICTQFTPVFLHPELKLKKNPSIQFKLFEVNTPTEIGYFGTSFFDTFLHQNGSIDYFKIGYFNTGNFKNNTNYIKVNIGKGQMHLYSTPLVFTNYYLRKKEVFDYSQNVFLHLKEGDIYWHNNAFANTIFNENKQEKGVSPFGVILNLMSFRYAWYSFLLVLLLFCLFNFKRKQRAIAVIEKNKNSSIEFAETITKLYLAEGNHKNIAMQKFHYFFNYIRLKFSINLQNNERLEKLNLAMKSKVAIERIEKIMFCYNQLLALPNTTKDELNELVTLINGFYEETN
jgi:hypothetical protein